MLSNVPVFPQNIAIPIIFLQQPTPSAHVLRSFWKSPRPQQVAGLQKIGIRAVDERVIPLMDHLPAEVDKVCGSTVEGREQRVARRRFVLSPDQHAEFEMTHVRLSAKASAFWSQAGR
jgi:hypothetical protein